MFGPCHENLHSPSAQNFLQREGDEFYDAESFVRIMPHFNEKTISTNVVSENKITLGKDVGK